MIVLNTLPRPPPPPFPHPKIYQKAQRTKKDKWNIASIAPENSCKCSSLSFPLVSAGEWLLNCLSGSLCLPAHVIILLWCLHSVSVFIALLILVTYEPWIVSDLLCKLVFPEFGIKKGKKEKKRNAVLWVLNIAFKVNAPFYPYLHYPNEKLYTKKIQKVIEKQSTFFYRFFTIVFI